jgi:hypothetical protein
MTPEARTKRRIKYVLDKYKNYIYYYMPVPGGYGSVTLDYIGFYHGHGFAIEAKRPGSRPTPRQMVVIGNMFRSGARVFVIDGTDQTDTIEDLERWFIAVEAGLRPDIARERHNDEQLADTLPSVV